MKRDILGQLELSIIQTDMAIMQTSDLRRKDASQTKSKLLKQNEALSPTNALIYHWRSAISSKTLPKQHPRRH